MSLAEGERAEAEAQAAPFAWRKLLRERILPVVLPLGIAALTARAAIAEVLTRLGHPGATLDDSYIHFQYARAIAEGHPFQFQAGEPATSGATSLLWPLLLAPFYAVGFTDESILWPAWILSFAAHGLLAYETYQLTKRLTGAAVAAGAAAMILGFSAFTWCAASGMEVMPFAWALARTARKASEWAEMQREQRSRGRAIELVALAWAAALFRPEGALLALFGAMTFVLYPRHPTLRSRALGLAALAGALFTPLVLLITTGTTTSNTTVVKLLVGNPYYPGNVLWETVAANAKTLVTKLLNGEEHAWQMIPEGGAFIALTGLVAIPIAGFRAKSLWRATSVVLIALLMFAPCFYDTFLWNRLRYLWPFATGWIIGIACLVRVLIVVPEMVTGLFASKGVFAWLEERGFRRGPAWTVPRWVGPLAGGILCGLLASKLGGHSWNRQGVIKDIGDSASGIDQQQVKLGRWAKDNLPEDARIGVNDTGAIAYFGDRKTFDVVGLTSASEAKYWVAGQGSRFEHYERLKATAPEKLPTHFIVYAQWMDPRATALNPGCNTVLGEFLHSATVTGDERAILGGDTMAVHLADYTMLGTGELPWTRMGEIVDSVDVANLESEAAHHYDLMGARPHYELVHVAWSPGGEPVADGGRTQRTSERFVVKLQPGRAARGVVRLDRGAAHQLEVAANGRPAGTIDLFGVDWREYAFDIPREAASPATTIELTAPEGWFATFHYWFEETE